MTDFSLVWNEAALHELLSGPSGPVAQDLARRAIRVESQAKINASHSPPSVRGSGPAVRSGRLRASITWVFGQDAIGLFVDIGSGVIYARRVEVDYDRPYLSTAIVAAQG